MDEDWLSGIRSSIGLAMNWQRIGSWLAPEYQEGDGMTDGWIRDRVVMAWFRLAAEGHWIGIGLAVLWLGWRLSWLLQLSMCGDA